MQWTERDKTLERKISKILVSLYLIEKPIDEVLTSLCISPTAYHQYQSSSQSGSPKNYSYERMS